MVLIHMEVADQVLAGNSSEHSESPWYVRFNRTDKFKSIDQKWMVNCELETGAIGGSKEWMCW